MVFRELFIYHGGECAAPTAQEIAVVNGTSIVRISNHYHFLDLLYGSGASLSPELALVLRRMDQRLLGLEAQAEEIKNLAKRVELNIYIVLFDYGVRA